MFPKIQAYYSQQLGIHVAAQIINVSRDDEPVERSIIFPHKILNLHKISQHNPTHSHQNGKVLDSGEIIMILSAHFSEQLSHQNPELKTLIDIRKHIEYLKSQHLNYQLLNKQ
jgi:hypothetical protein